VLCSWSGRWPDHEHSTAITTVKPEAATAVVELLTMSGRTPEICWAVNKRQDNKLKNCYIWLVIYLNLPFLFPQVASKIYKPIPWLTTTDKNNLSLWSGREVLILRSVLHRRPLARGIFLYLEALFHCPNCISRSFQAHSVRTLWKSEFLVSVKGYNAKQWINARVICGNHNSKWALSNFKGLWSKWYKQ